MFISVRDEDKAGACDDRARAWCTSASRWSRPAAPPRRSARAGVPCERVNKVLEGSPHCVDLIKQGQIDMVINTTSGAQAIRDSYSIRRQTLMSGIAYFTTLAAASAAVGAIEAGRAARLAFQRAHAAGIPRDL